MGQRGRIALITAEFFQASTKAETFEAAKNNLKNCTRCEDETSVDLDKDWHAIHFLLTGDTKWSFLNTGVQVAVVDGHYEVHSPRDVAALHARLSKTTPSALMSNFNPTKFDELKI